MPRRLSKSGFTLTELLVVIAIIGVLASIALPAVMYARNLADKAACANNLKDLGLAVRNYESNKEHFPPSFYNVGNVRVNWIVALLPYLEQQNLADQITSSNGAVFNTTTQRINKLICRSDEAGPFGLSYAANCGRQDSVTNNLFSDAQGTGVFYDRSSLAGTKVTIDSGDIYDGASQTILIAENSDAGGENTQTATASQWNRNLEHQVGLCWFETTELAQADIDSENYVGFGQRFGDKFGTKSSEKILSLYPGYAYARPAGYHSGVVNVLFCDGSVKAINRGINYKVYCQMMTSDSRKIPQTSRGWGPISD